MLKDALDNVLHWIINSSSDPNEVSLTIKGLLISAVPSIMFALGIAHGNLGLTAIIDAFITFVQAVTTVVGALITLLPCLAQGLEHYRFIQLILSRPVLLLEKPEHAPAGNKPPPCRVP